MEHLENMKKHLEHGLQQIESKIGQGKPLEPEKAHIVNEVIDSLFKIEMICFIESLKKNPHKITEAIGKMAGGQGNQGMMNAFANAIGLPNIGFDTSSHHMPGTTSPYGDHNDMEMRRGVPGSGRGRRAEMDGNYGEMNNDMEMRRGRSSRTGRYVHRAEMDDNMTDNYDMDNRQGQPGTGQGNTGGTTGRR